MMGLPEDEVAAADVIRRLVVGFANGVPEHRLVSPSFGMHEGRGREAWLEHELGEFRRRRDAFGLDADLTVAVDGFMDDGAVAFSVTNAEGTLIYQDSWRIERGMVAGNGRAFEIVSKLRFKKGEAARRALAVRSVRGRILAVAPVGLAADECHLADGMNREDGFSTFTMLLPDDDLAGKAARFRIADSSGHRSTEKVWMRGYVHPQADPELFPVIEGRKVTVPGRLRAWELNVALADGRTLSTEHPMPGVHSYEMPVARAVLTDTMDHDWETAA